MYVLVFRTFFSDYVYNKIFFSDFDWARGFGIAH